METIVVVISTHAVANGRQGEYEARLCEEGYTFALSGARVAHQSTSFVVKSRKKLVLRDHLAQQLEDDAQARNIALKKTEVVGRFSSLPVVALLVQRKDAFVEFERLQFDLVRVNFVRGGGSDSCFHSGRYLWQRDKVYRT